MTHRHTLEKIWFIHAGEWRVRGLWCSECGYFEDFWPGIGVGDERS